MRAALVVLVAIGVTAAVGRGWYPGSFTARVEPVRAATIAAFGIEDPFIAERPAVLAMVDGRFGEYRWVTLLHVIPGALFLLLAPLQFSPTIRKRYLTFHRWSGRSLLVLGLVIGVTGMFFGVLMPLAGPNEAVVIAIFSSLFLFALARAFIAIRRREIARHREWMIRAFATAIAISTVRIVAGIADLVLTPLGYRVPTIFVISIWTGWLVTLGVAELWLARTRSSAAAYF